MLTDTQVSDLSNHLSADINISKTQIRSVSGGGGGREEKSVIVPFAKECKSFLEKLFTQQNTFYICDIILKLFRMLDFRLPITHNLKLFHAN